MSVVKCHIKNLTDIEKVSFKNFQCLLTISVGQEYHEGENFSATIDLVNATFHSCTIMLYDTLQRYTMALNDTNGPDFFYNKAFDEGTLWLERNKKYYERLNNLSGIIRWDTWLNHPDFYPQQNTIRKLLKDDDEYMNGFNKTIDEFLQRYCRRLSDDSTFDKERAYKLCLDYLVEECSALCLWPETNCGVELYPNPRNLAMEITHKHFVLEKHPGILYSIGIKFKNKKQLKPQQFNSLLTES